MNTELLDQPQFMHTMENYGIKNNDVNLHTLKDLQAML